MPYQPYARDPYKQAEANKECNDGDEDRDTVIAHDSGNEDQDLGIPRQWDIE